MKRIGALLLSLLLFVGIFPCQAFAGEASVNTQIVENMLHLEITGIDTTDKAQTLSVAVIQSDDLNAPDSDDIIYANTVYVNGKDTLQFNIDLGDIDIYNYHLIVGDTTGQIQYAQPLAVKATYTITASAGEGGAISVEGETNVVEGSDITYTVTANEGYHVASVLVDGGQVELTADGTFTFQKVTANHTIEAFFEKDLDSGKEDDLGGGYIPVNPLDTAKKDASAEVTTYVDPDDYADTEAAEVKTILEQAKKDIEAATTAEEVEAIKAAAKAEIDKIETAEEKALIAEVEKAKFKARSKLTKLNGKRAIKIYWNVSELGLDGYEVFRSVKKNSGFGKKPIFTTKMTSYTNNKDLKPGKTYYYKVRGFKYVNDEKVYTKSSWKAWRTIK